MLALGRAAGKDIVFLDADVAQGASEHIGIKMGQREPVCPIERHSLADSAALGTCGAAILPKAIQAQSGRRMAAEFASALQGESRPWHRKLGSCLGEDMAELFVQKRLVAGFDTPDVMIEPARRIPLDPADAMCVLADPDDKLLACQSVLCLSA